MIRTLFFFSFMIIIRTPIMHSSPIFCCKTSMPIQKKRLQNANAPIEIYFHTKTQDVLYDCVFRISSSTIHKQMQLCILGAAQEIAFIHITIIFNFLKHSHNTQDSILHSFLIFIFLSTFNSFLTRILHCGVTCALVTAMWAFSGN